MATTLYLRDSNVGITTYNRLASFMRGGATQSLVGSWSVTPTWVSIGFFSTRPIVPFTLSQSITFNLWGLEASPSNNAFISMRVYKLSGGVLSASLGQAASASELTTSSAVYTASVTPTSTAFSGNDILVFEIGVSGGSMSASGSSTFFYNGATVGASGDSYITLTDNISLKHRVRNIT